MARLLARLERQAADLWREHPPRIHHAKKRVIFERAGGVERIPRGSLVVSQWAPSEEATVGAMVSVESVAGPFRYEALRDRFVWHVNFADTYLFAFYGGPAFAQDEIQVAEHPILASVRGWLDSGAVTIPALTRTTNGPAPILVRNVERWCAIDTNPQLARPFGIYGRQLSRASDEAVAQGVMRLDEGPLSNVIAMVAPQGMGRYSSDQIRDILDTAVTSFVAAKEESGAARVRIHTGHWGTGAFGGDRVLMAAAQIVAARCAGVDELVYHSLDEAAVQAFENGRAVAETIAIGASIEEVVALLEAREFYWGRSDGN
ncbi:Hypothetical protein AKJ09_10288 [Labilithrix luteola]|uniref:PARG catalytic Macro domain-containing protein n=1 Tax=Labilithrix luteola TaxID=1391654 RepID=A0A0K1QDW4_9BACT|nr:hypothetical protein [Labilithrix luteola]AKV03625.1 Hypothetical protein AKJ09_10288 [Labilithrix luteola]